MKATLNMKDRINLLFLLPTEGTYEKLAVAWNLREKVKFTNDEIDEYGIRTAPSGGTSWSDTVKDLKFDYELDELEHKLVVEALAERDRGGKLVADQMGLYRTFVLNQPAEDGADG